MKVCIKNVTKNFKSNGDHQKVVALNGLSFDVSSGEFLCLVGPSGCGKSTIINLIAGFTFPDSGEVLMDDQKIKKPGLDRIVVFQEHAIFPWKTVRENIEFGLSSKSLNKTERNNIADEMIHQVELDGFADKYPNELSVGMRQRVSIARALATKPKLILMDEPFSAVDQQTRVHLQKKLLDIQHQLKTTIIFVTHNIEEAIYLGDRVIVLDHRPGRVKEIFNTSDYSNPTELREKICKKLENKG